MVLVPRRSSISDWRWSGRTDSTTRGVLQAGHQKLEVGLRHVISNNDASGVILTVRYLDDLRRPFSVRRELPGGLFPETAMSASFFSLLPIKVGPLLVAKVLGRWAQWRRVVL